MEVELDSVAGTLCPIPKIMTSQNIIITSISEADVRTATFDAIPRVLAEAVERIDSSAGDSAEAEIVTVPALSSRRYKPINNKLIKKPHGAGAKFAHSFRFSSSNTFRFSLSSCC
jgi:hypothetical protein